ncbi:MAG TPA: toprim domain-containing protein [Reyranella sp.]|nr:toprim domain-containing protein [Reyranella sp.]
MSETAADVTRHLAARAEDVCRYYLSNGRREGRTWRVGDIDNTPGRSLCVQLTETSRTAAGRWIDFATSEYGDLLDLIARAQRLDTFRDVVDEARQFLSLPERSATQPAAPPAPSRSREAARRLFASAKPIGGTLAETYLRSRGITNVNDLMALRFHPHCWYRAHDDAPRETWPALIAAVTDLHGRIAGVQRTWLARDGSGKAPLAIPRRAMGQLAGNGVRFGVPTEMMAAGEGLETMLALRQVLPALPMVAALSATHLAMLILPPGLRRLYVARDNDRAGHRAAGKLAARAMENGVEALLLTPSSDDFNTNLCTLGRETLMASVRAQLTPEDVARFLGEEHRSERRPCRRALPSGSPSQSAAPGLHEGDRARSG